MNLETGNILQVVSVVAAAIAAIGSWRTASITAKQYKLNHQEQIKKYRPFFKIKGYHKNNEGYFFDIINQGYPFFAISHVRWDGDAVIIKDYFNAEMERSKTKGSVKTVIEKYENLTIVIKIAEKANTEGFIEINGFDIEYNDFKYKTPLIRIEDGKIVNGLYLTYQNLV